MKRDYDEEEKGFNNSDSDNKPVNVDHTSDGSEGSSSSDSAASTPERGSAIPTVLVTNRGSPQEEDADSSSDSGDSNQQSQDMDVDSD